MGDLTVLNNVIDTSVNKGSYISKRPDVSTVKT